jgi:curved DNA-binding protein CbpA
MMEEFIDYYEILEVSPNANSGSVERMFRYLAQLYHPDNPETGDRARFDLVLEAHATLKDPAMRAQYDIQYKDHLAVRFKLVEEVGKRQGIERDLEIQNKLLSIFYVKRRHNANEPGIPEHELERLLDCPLEHLEFHLWYLKAKGWIAKNDSGMFTITVEGVDRASSSSPVKATNRLITDRAHGSRIHEA